MAEEVIRVSDISKSFDGNFVLKDVSLSVKKGESVAIIGRSGVGKSVLIRHIAGLLMPNSGSIHIYDKDVTYIPIESRYNYNFSIGVLFQSSALFDSLTVLENVIFGVSIHKKMTQKQKKDLAADILPLVGLEIDVLDKYPSELSGGMQKRVALARLIAYKPDILLIDEPTSGLDPIYSDLIGSLIRDTVAYLKATSIVITHDMKLASKLGQRIYLLHESKVYWFGSYDEIYNSKDKVLRQFVDGSST